MSAYKIISSDDHIFEPPDLWTARVEPKFRDRAPHIVRLEDGSGDWWVCEGRDIMGLGGGSQAGKRFVEPENLTRTDFIENVRPGAYLPEARIEDMEIDGVDVSVIYPTVGFMLYRSVPDSELLTALCGTYNDWLAEFCRPFPNRLKGIGMLNTDDVQVGIKELERCAKIGLAGVMITVYPPENISYDSPVYEPLWAAAQDLDIPLSLHVASERPGHGEVYTRDFTTAAMSANADHWVRMSLANIIFSGVFERYPKLQVGSVEHELSWAPHFLERMDYTYTQKTPRDYWHRFKEDMLPSDYFHRNVFVGFQEDAKGVQDRHIIGIDNLHWGSDYPHQESTFPRSQQILEEILADCTEEEKAKIAGKNAAKVYRLD